MEARDSSKTLLPVHCSATSEVHSPDTCTSHKPWAADSRFAASYLQPTATQGSSGRAVTRDPDSILDNAVPTFKSCVSLPALVAIAAG